jgi:hypothetical protein
MVRWPTAGWKQAAIAFVMALISAIYVGARVNNVQIERYTREYPHDGQIGLGALIDAFDASAYTLIGVFLVLFVLQRRITVKR